MELKVNELGPITPLIQWIDKHPVLSNVILWLEVVALALSVLFYDFTTY